MLLIAKEKEKNTLRGLMLSPASTLEILGGKSLLSFVLRTFVTAWVEQYPILKVAEYMPNVQFIELAVKVEEGANIGNVVSNIGVIGIWVIAVFTLTLVMYRKRMVD